MCSRSLPILLAVWYLDMLAFFKNPTALLDMNAAKNRMVEGTKKLNIFQVSMIVFSFFIGQHFQLLAALHALMWPAIILAGVVVLTCLAAGIAYGLAYLAHDPSETAQQSCISALKVTCYAVDALFIGLCLSLGMAGVGALYSMILPFSTATIGQLTYLSVFLGAAAIGHFYLTPPVQDDGTIPTSASYSLQLVQYVTPSSWHCDALEPRP